MTTPANNNSALALATATVRLLIDAAPPAHKDAVTEAATSAGLLWRCLCSEANECTDAACTACRVARPWTQDVTPRRYSYGELLDDLRAALKEWFDEQPGPRPAAIGFRITTDYDDGPAWATDGATAYFTSLSSGTPHRGDFGRSLVADALIEISEFDQPQFGDTLRVAVPAP